MSKENTETSLTLWVAYGLLGVGLFSFGIASVVGFIISIVKSGNNSVERSHYKNISNTFICFIALTAIGWLTLPVFGFGWIVLVCGYIWYGYRTIKGIALVINNKPYK